MSCELIVELSRMIDTEIVLLQKSLHIQFKFDNNKLFVVMCLFRYGGVENRKKITRLLSVTSNDSSRA